MLVENRSWRDLKPPKKDARKERDPITFARIEADILKRGIRNPLYIEPDGHVIEGETRRQIAVKNQIEDIPCVVMTRELTETEYLTEQIQGNACRADFRPMEEAELYQRLMVINGWDQVAVAKHLGHANASDVCKKLKTKSSLATDLQEHINSGKLAFSVGYSICRLADQAAQRELAAKAMAGMSRDAIDAEVTKLMGKKKPGKAKPIKVQHSGISLVLPGDFTFEALSAVASRLLAGCKRGMQGDYPMSMLGKLMSG